MESVLVLVLFVLLVGIMSSRWWKKNLQLPTYTRFCSIASHPNTKHLTATRCASYSNYEWRSWRFFRNYFYCIFNISCIKWIMNVDLSIEQIIITIAIHTSLSSSLWLESFVFAICWWLSIITSDYMSVFVCGQIDLSVRKKYLSSIWMEVKVCLCLFNVQQHSNHVDCMACNSRVITRKLDSFEFIYFFFWMHKHFHTLARWLRMIWMWMNLT